MFVHLARPLFKALFALLDVETISADEKQRIREAKLKFMQGEKPENVPRAVKQVGKLKNEGIFKGTELEKQEERHVESNGDVIDEESLDLEAKLQGIDTHHDGYGKIIQS